MTYSEKLKDPRWQKKRLDILNRDEFTCQLCSDTESTLHIHHKNYASNPWDSKNNQLITYCLHCHSLIEYHKENNILSEPVRVIKRKMGGGYVLYSLNRNSNNAMAILMFDYDNDVCGVDFRSAIFPEILEVINKELVKQKRRR